MNNTAIDIKKQQEIARLKYLQTISQFVQNNITEQQLRLELNKLKTKYNFYLDN